MFRPTVWSQLKAKLNRLVLCSFNDSASKTQNVSQYNERNANEYMESCDETALRAIASSLKVIDNFVTEQEESDLMAEIEPYMKRLRYESSHWDDAIHGYRETEKLKWRAPNDGIIERIRRFAFPEGVPQIKFVHVLDLAKEGYIKPHIDSVRFCGDIIAGLSLLSSSVMRLVNENNKNLSVDVLLNRRSLYIMSGDSRHLYTHEILGQTVSKFKGRDVLRERRVSVICRNEPNFDNKLT